MQEKPKIHMELDLQSTNPNATDFDQLFEVHRSVIPLLGERNVQTHARINAPHC